MAHTDQGKWCPVSAVVDTAAEITIVAQRVNDKMFLLLEISSSINVNLAGGGATMAVVFIGNAFIDPVKTFSVCCPTSI